VEERQQGPLRAAGDTPDLLRAGFGFVRLVIASPFYISSESMVPTLKV
jgi:hypothetical protein